MSMSRIGAWSCVVWPPDLEGAAASATTTNRSSTGMMTRRIALILPVLLLLVVVAEAAAPSEDRILALDRYKSEERRVGKAATVRGKPARDRTMTTVARRQT